MNSRISLPRLLFASLGLALAFPSATRAANDFPAFKESEYQPPQLSRQERMLQVDYPTAASVRGVAKGRAVVSVLVDADGTPLDFLLTSATDPAFGKALLEELQTRKYEPAKLQGRPVPGRCAFTYNFEARGITAMNVIDASSSRTPSGKNPQAREAVAEAKLDHRLEVLEGNVPAAPKGVGGLGDKPVKVFVTFFVDETGQLRAPNVESAASPELLAPVVGALSTWKFKPPTVGGKPALVFVGRPIPVVAAERK